MPLVRIDLRKGKDAADRQEIGRVVYEALVGVGVPKNDRFQVIGEHEAENFLFDPDYIGKRQLRRHRVGDNRLHAELRITAAASWSAC